MCSNVLDAQLHMFIARPVPIATLDVAPQTPIADARDANGRVLLAGLES